MTAILRTPPVAAVSRTIGRDERAQAQPGGTSPGLQGTPRTPDAPASRASATIPMASSPLTAAAIASSTQDGQDAGYRDGREAGEAAGREAGWRQGHAEGLEAGLAQGREAARGESTEAAHRAAAALERLAGLGAAIDGALDGLLAQAEADALEALLAAVVKLCGAMHADADHLAASYRAALAEVRGTRAARVRLHPDDLAFLQSQGPEQGDGIDRLPDVALVPDSRIALGGCVIETGGGELDARLDRQLARLAEVLSQARSRRTAIE